MLVTYRFSYEDICASPPTNPDGFFHMKKFRQEKAIAEQSACSEPGKTSNTLYLLSFSCVSGNIENFPRNIISKMRILIVVSAVLKEVKKMSE